MLIGLHGRSDRRFRTERFHLQAVCQAFLSVPHLLAALYADVSVSHHKQGQIADDTGHKPQRASSEALVMMVSWLMASSIPVGGTAK